MPLQTHISGCLRSSPKRELKFAEESCWKGESAQAEFRAKAQAVEAPSWQPQIEAA